MPTGLLQEPKEKNVTTRRAFLEKICGKYMVVSKNSGTPKRMVYMETPIKMDDLGVPPFKETST